MAEDSKPYFEQRAAEESEAADHAGDKRAADSHRELARRYRLLAESGEPRPRTRAHPTDDESVTNGFKVLP